MQKTVSIIIPNWNGKKLLAKNLPSVLAAADKLETALHEIIIVDDGSTDGSSSFLNERFPSVTVIALEKNVGFHRATNIGFNKSSSDIVILLNSDVEPAPDAFIHLIPHFDNPELFGVNGRIYSGDKQNFLYGNRGAYFKWGHFFLCEKNEFDSSQNLFVCGGAGAFDRKKFLALGGFDILFSPFYYEEQDVSYRALKRGWHIRYEPASIMYHQVRGSIGKKISTKRIGYISARNNYLFVVKNITDIDYTLATLLFIPLFLIRDIFCLRFRFWIAFAMTLPRIPSALIKRFKEHKYSVRTDKEILRSVIQS